jgi:hypothetical protein
MVRNSEVCRWSDPDSVNLYQLVFKLAICLNVLSEKLHTRRRIHTYIHNQAEIEWHYTISLSSVPYERSEWYKNVKVGGHLSGV